jgi:hypothetical protein
VNKQRAIWGAGLILGLLLPTIASGPAGATPFDYIQKTDDAQGQPTGGPGTQTFYGAEQPVGNGTARCFITAAGTVPLSVGWELTDGALTNLPDVAPDAETPVYTAPLPPQASSLGLPFKYMIIIYSSGHRPPNTAEDEPPHFHAALLVNFPQTTSPPFPLENAPVNPTELPPGVNEVILTSGSPVLVPGVGVNYDDPTEPAGFPPLTTLGQNFFYFNGHMNAIVLGPTIDFLSSKADSAAAIKQPPVYPAPGNFPLIWTARYDPVKMVHVIAVLDFRAAQQWVQP